MRPKRSLRARSTALLAAVGAPLSALVIGLSGCDNSACVFGEGGCLTGGSGSGGLGASPATFPEDGQWIRSGAPQVEASFPPNGASVAPSTPLAVRFDETVAASTLAGSFELIDLGTGSAVSLASPSLVGDGRLAVLRPNQDLTDGSSYELRGTAAASATDLEGNLVSGLADSVLTSFTVDDAGTPNLDLVTTYPVAGASDQSRTTEIVAVFDRPVVPASLSVATFQVTVDGSAPAVNPQPQPLSSGGLLDYRVARWKSVDTTTGFATDLGAGATGLPAPRVTLTLASLAAQAGGTPLSEVVTFDLLSFRAPTGAVLNSLSTDGIGIADLIGAPAPLTVDVQLADGQPNDVVELFLFGLAPDASQDIAVARSKTLTAATLVDTWDADDLALAPTTAPVSAALGDGFVAFAFRLVRGGVGTPVRLLDVDPAEDGIQDALLDTVAPELTGFGPDGGDATVLRSDVRDLVVVGDADEELRWVDVDAPGIGSHSLMTEVVGSNASGAFVAAPLRIPAAGGAPNGMLAETAATNGVPFTVTLYDRVGNASMAMAGTFFQVGTHGPGAALPGAAQITVGAFSSTTLQPISGARVFVHDTAGAAVVGGTGTTDATGFVQVAAAAATPSVVTIDAPQFDLFTYDGVTRARISALLDPTGLPAGVTVGTVSSPNADIGLLTGAVTDSRRVSSGPLTVAAGGCQPNVITGETECTFASIPVVSGPLGALSYVGNVGVAMESAYVVNDDYLLGFALDVPRVPVLGGSQAAVIQVDRLLDEVGVPMSEKPVDQGGPAMFTDLLVDPTDPMSTNRSDGAPRFAATGVVHGLRGRVLVGGIHGFDDDDDDVWNVYSELAGAVDGGTLDGTVVDDGATIADAGRKLVTESRDASGNRAGRRRTYPVGGGAPAPPALPTITAPTPGAPPTGSAYLVSVSDVLPDGLAQNGIYRVRLTGSDGRRWNLVKRDEVGAADVDLRVPDIASSGGSPLPSGNVDATSSAFAWPTFSEVAWMFTDAERLHDHFAERFDHSFSQP